MKYSISGDNEVITITITLSHEEACALNDRLLEEMRTQPDLPYEEVRKGLLEICREAQANG